MEKVKKNELITKFEVFIFFLYIVFFYIFGADAEKIRYSEIILMIFFGLEAVRISKAKKIKYCIPIITIFLFTFYCFLSNFWAINAQLAISRSWTLMLLAVFLLVSYNFFSNIENSEEILLKVIMYTGIILSIYVIMYYGIGRYFTLLMNGKRVGTEINNVNAIGLETSISVIIAIFYALYNKEKKYLPFAIIPLIVSLGTASRKVMILMVLGTILLFVLRKEEKINLIKTSKKIVAFAIIVGIFIGVSKLSVFSNTFNRLESMFDIVTEEKKTDDSTKIRELFINAGIKQFAKTPVLGIGIANSGYITMEVTGGVTYLHNNFVELLSTTGIIGFILYYFSYIYIIVYCIKFFNRRNKYINIALIIILINVVLEYGMVSYFDKTIYIYILFGLITITHQKEEEKKNEQAITSDKIS